MIGGGVAGWTAARRAQQLGASVALLDRGAVAPGLSNSLMSGGRIHAAYRNPRTADPDALYEAIMAKTDGTARSDVARAWAANTGRAIDFLAAEGAEIVALGDAEYVQTTLSADGASVAHATDYWQGGGPERLLTRMYAAFVGAGGTYRPARRAVELLVRDGVVIGVDAELADGGRERSLAGAVVMADGGFQANRELVARHITRHPYRPHGSPYDVGDCLLMATRIGARTTQMDAFYGNLVLRDSIDNPKLRMAPSVTELLDACPVVDADGNRMGDEGLGTDEWSVIDVSLATDVARSLAPAASWLVMDSETWEVVGRSEALAARNRLNTGVTLNPLIPESGGTLLTGDTLDELAHAAEVPPVALRATIEGFNAFCTAGTPVIPRRTGSPRPVLRPPFHAIPLVLGIFFAMGGLVVDAHARVLSGDDRAIPGLYAAGGTMGGLQGGPRNGYAGGWSEAATFGMLAAEHAAQVLNGRRVP